jgi:hypothetical protein
MRTPALTSFVLTVVSTLCGPAWAGVLVTVDKSAQRMTVAVDGKPRHSWPVSTGSRGYETPTGTFRPFRMEEDHYSREWDEAPMPHSIFFTNSGHAIHGSTAVRRLGSPASHGCVRLAPANAAKLFALVHAEGMNSTKVVVIGTKRSAVVRRPTPVVKQVRAAPPPAYETPRRPQLYEDGRIARGTADWW